MLQMDIKLLFILFTTHNAHALESEIKLMYHIITSLHNRSTKLVCKERWNSERMCSLVVVNTLITFCRVRDMRFLTYHPSLA
jgi:hypothetical protein